MRTAIPKIPKLIWKRLPWIAVYAVAITALLFVGEFIFYRYASPEHFIHYTSFHVNTVEEHKDVPFEACKTTDYAYHIQGDRKIYKIPEGKGEIDKVVVKQYSLDSIISKDHCVNAFITTSQYDFVPGNYQIYTTFNFNTKYGNRKSITFKSNIFQVLPSHPITVEDIQKRIDELQKEIDLLRAQLELAKQGIPVTITPVQTTPVTTSSSPSSQPATPTPTPPPSQGLLPDSIPLIGKLL